MKLPSCEAATAASLRLVPQVEVCEAAGEIWLRGPRLDDALAALIGRLPGALRYDVGEDGALTRAGRRLPSGRLPERKWILLRNWLVLKLQRVSPPGQPKDKTRVLIERGGPELPARVLLTELSAWSDWARTAPAARLAPLLFAASASGEVLVWGHPLPPIRGARHSEHEKLAVPCGFTWVPRIDASILREAAGAAPGDLLLLGEDGRCEVVEVEAFVQATRASVRLTASSLRDKAAARQARRRPADE
ncbi:MAG: hypothetical protein HY303_04415 [Candidatus Wallbacteria bacterium]|nr:hypothetical protein [Candidatus Wallbacteria bacterium]